MDWLKKVKEWIRTYDVRALKKEGFWGISFDRWGSSIQADLEKISISKENFLKYFKYEKTSNNSRSYCLKNKSNLDITLYFGEPEECKSDCSIVDEKLDKIFTIRIK